MAENKLSVILYEDTIDALIDMPEESMAKVMKAILCSTKGLEMPALSQMEAVLFRLLYGQVERAGNLSKRRSEAGSSKKAKQTEANEEQISANSEQTETNENKTDTNVNTITSTITDTLTNTENLPPISPTGDDVDVPAEPPKAKQGVRTSSDVVRQRFERFWVAYPKKQGKGAAEKAWIKLKPSEALTNQMLQALEFAKKCAQWNRDGGQYIPNPATWLNQKRWEDDYREVMEAESQPPNYGSFLPDW